jgi:hypothetical protein
LSRRRFVAVRTRGSNNALTPTERPGSRTNSAIFKSQLLGFNSSAMRLRHLYLVLCVLGAILPGWKLLPWLMDHGLNLSLLCQELFATRIGAFFGLDVVISAVVLLVFIAVEGRRLAMSVLWLPIIATLLVGVSLGFPLFLFLRQRTIDAARPR